MTNFSIERAVNKEFYALFTGDNGEPVWRTTDTYTRKAKAVEAIIVVADFFSRLFAPDYTEDDYDINIKDNTLRVPATKVYISKKSK